MNIKRANEIVKNREILDIYYNDRAVWIQELDNNIAKVGFMDNSEEKDVYIDDLYEHDLYSK